MLERYVDTAAGVFTIRGVFVMVIGGFILVSVTLIELFPLIIDANILNRMWLRPGNVFELCLLPAAGIIAIIEGVHITAFELDEDKAEARSIVDYWALNRVSGLVTTVAFFGLLTWGIGSFSFRHDSGFAITAEEYVRWIVGPEWNGYIFSFLYFALLFAPCFLFIYFQKTTYAKIALYITPIIHIALYFAFPGRFMLEAY